MENYTLEKYEWENVWWEDTTDKEHKRVFYIGDSISCGTRIFATAASKNTLLFDGLGTSKSLDNPFFYESIERTQKQQLHTEAIAFNNGLHGWHLTEEEYGDLYRKMLKFLKEKFKGIPIFAVLTTTTRNNPDYDAKRVVLRNNIVSKIAEEMQVPVIDLYSVSCRKEENFLGDGVHFTDDGYRLLGEKMFEEISKVLK